MLVVQSDRRAFGTPGSNRDYWPNPFFIDEVLPPWRPRGLEVRGRAEVMTEPQAMIRVHPERIIGWGIDNPPLAFNARNVR